jgi:hypothetical protein
MTTSGASPDLSLEDGLDLSGMSFNELWLRQVSVGGAAGSLETEAYLLGLLVPDPHQYDILAQALNEHFVELGQDHPVGYWDATVRR